MMNKIRAKYLLAEDGFSLIELMIALTIFAIGLLALAQLQTHSIIYNAQAQSYTEATMVAQQKIEELRADDFVNLDSYDGDENLVDKGSAADYYTITTTVANGPVDETKEVTVLVEWTHKGDKSYTLNTIITQR